MTLEDEIVKNMADQLSNDIDKEVLFGMLEGIGWTRVLLPRFTSREHAVDLVEWLAVNCKHPYERKGNEVIFENQQDAVWYTLKWL